MRKKNMILKDDSCIFEKKKWISVTGLCNNNCIFCLDGWRKDRFHRKYGEVLEEVRRAYEEGCTKLVLSGGEPTIHPRIIDFVRFGKEIGFGKIQVISNGRMFSSKEFTEAIIDAGLDEVTFSIHGCNSKMHDSLTRVPGSFRQAMTGIKNVLGNTKKVIVNTDTCMTGLNYKKLPKIIRYIVEKASTREVNLMNIVPQGNAWDHRNFILYDCKDAAPYVHEVIDYCIDKKVVLWLSRFPPEYLEGYEEFIEDPFKLVDDVRGRIDMLKDTPSPRCKGRMCKYCSINNICEDFIMINCPPKIGTESMDYKTIIIRKDNYMKLAKLVESERKNGILLKFVEPCKRLEEYRKIAPKITDILPYMKKIDWPGIYISGIPPCILLMAGIKNMRHLNYKDTHYSKYVKSSRKDYFALAEELARKVKIKKHACRECIFYDECRGLFQNYVRIFGFGELSPVKIREIRINLGCNQDCVFCNTDSNAENLFIGKKETLEKIDEYSRQGINYLIISGREPTIDENLLEYIRFARFKGFMKIELQTNAIRCSDKNYCRKLIDAGLTHAFVSLHAADEEMSSKITRAPRTFKSTIRGIINLRDNGVEITINIVVNSINYPQLKPIVKFIHEEIDPKSIIFSMVAPVVSAWKNREIIPKLTATIPSLIEAFEYCKNNNIDFRIPSRCGIPICIVEKYKDHHDEFLSPSRFSNSNDKIKGISCKDCFYNNSCTGLWKNYAKLYGTEELKPKKRNCG